MDKSTGEEFAELKILSVDYITLRELRERLEVMLGKDIKMLQELYIKIL